MRGNVMLILAIVHGTCPHAQRWKIKFSLNPMTILLKHPGKKSTSSFKLTSTVHHQLRCPLTTFDISFSVCFVPPNHLWISASKYRGNIYSDKNKFIMIERYYVEFLEGRIQVSCNLVVFQTPKQIFTHIFPMSSIRVYTGTKNEHFKFTQGKHS